MVLDFKDKLVLVNGGAGTLGRPFCFEFARLGAKGIILLDINNDKVQKVKQDLESEGFKAWAFQTDIASDDSVSATAKQVLQDIGVPDIIHNLAVNALMGGPLDTTPDAIAKSFDVSVLGYHRVVQAFLPQMIERKSGWIINTSSPAGLTPPAIVAKRLMPYAICKAANHAHAWSLAAFLKPYGIGVSVLFPGLALPPQENVGSAVPEMGNAVPDDFQEYMKEQIMTIGQSPEEAARVMTEDLRKGEFFATGRVNYANIVREYADKGFDPNAEYTTW